MQAEKTITIVSDDFGKGLEGFRILKTVYFKCIVNESKKKGYIKTKKGFFNLVAFFFYENQDFKNAVILRSL